MWKVENMKGGRKTDLLFTHVLSPGALACPCSSLATPVNLVLFVFVFLFLLFLFPGKQRTAAEQGG